MSTHNTNEISFQFQQKLRSFKLKCIDFFTLRLIGSKVSDLYLKLNEMQQKQIECLNEEIRIKKIVSNSFLRNAIDPLNRSLKQSESELRKFNTAHDKTSEALWTLRLAFMNDKPITQDMVNQVWNSHHSCDSKPVLH